MAARRSTLRSLAALTVLLVCGLAWARSQAANAAVTPVSRVDAWWLARHEAKVAEAKAGGVDLLFVGDSITQNYEKTGPAPDEVFAPAWVRYFAPHHAMNLGFSGDRTEHVLWRLQHGEVEGIAPKDVVLMIGTNNTAVRQTAEQVTAGTIAVVEELHRRLPGARVLVLGILPSGISEEKSAADMAVNMAVAGHYAGSRFVRCLDLSELFMRDGVLDRTMFYDVRLSPPRGPLHPDAEAQTRMAARVAAALYGAEAVAADAPTASGK
jgi:lysophospholipase L1-like esterase